MSLTEKPSTPRCKNLLQKSERISEMFVPNQRNASEEALICLTCPLPAKSCKPNRCKRYEEERVRLKNGARKIL